MTLNQTTRAIQRIIGTAADGIYGPATAGAVLNALRANDPIIAPPDNDPSFNTRTERNLATLQPGAQEKFRPFVRRAIAIGASMGVDVKVICGLRNKADQEAAKRSGASRAGFGFSWHNFGMAIDFGCFKGSVYVGGSSNSALAERVYAAIGAVANQYGIDWGGDWRSFKDTPHFQINGPATPSVADRNKLFNGTYSFS